MRILGTIAFGMMALLGSPALADLPLPPVKQASTNFNGCDYSIKSQPFEGLGPGQTPLIYYKIILQREQGPYCWFPPATQELLTASYEPELAIVSNFQGLVAAYSWTTYTRSGLKTQISVRQLEPYPVNMEALEIKRQSTLVAYQFDSPVSGGLMSSVYLDRLNLHLGNLEVRGRLEGTWITAEGETYPGPLELYEGDHFIAIYPDIFNTVQRPLFVTY